MKYFKKFENKIFSNLPLNLQGIVRTPQFKEWFGDWENDPENSSKVVDENGEPLVVYHTTHNKKFDEFRKSFDHIIDNKFKQVYKGVDIPDDEWEDFKYKKENEDGVSEYSEFWFSTKKWGDSGYVLPCFLNIRNIAIGEDGDEGGQGIYYEYVRSGQDGLKIPNGQNTGGDFYVTTSPESIKLADGSNIAFNKNSKKITE